MRIAVAAEAAVLAAVLAMSAMLVQTTPGRTEVASSEPVSTGDYAVTLDSELYSLQFLLEPAGRGNNLLHLYAYAPDGDPQVVQEWSATAAMPAAGVEPIEIPLVTLTDNHAIGEVALPVAGDWEFRFTLRVSDIDQASVGTTVPIS
jgi:copper transport protein